MFKLAALLAMGISVQCYGDTLAEIYQLALQNDYKLQSAHSAYLAQREDVYIARAGLLPKVEFEGYWRDGENASGITSSNPFAVETDITEVGESVGYSITLMQPLVDLGAYHNYRRGTLRSKIAEMNFQREKQALIFRVADSYLSTLKYGAELEAAKSIQQAYTGQLDSIKGSFEAGLVQRSAVKQVQAALDASKAETIVARNQLDVSFDALKVITGVDHKNVYTLKSSFEAQQPEPQGVSAWIQAATDDNFELLLTKLQTHEAEQSYKSARAQHLPKLTVSVQYNNHTEDREYSYAVGDELELDGYQAELNLKVPIFSGGNVSASRRQAKYLYLEQRDISRDTAREVEQAAHSLFLRIIAGVATVNARRVAMDSRRSALDSIRNGYNEGVETISDLLDAERLHFEEQVRYFDAIYTYLVAGLRLQQITSQLDNEDIARLNSLLDITRPITNPRREQ